jgi:peptidoglycan hydrolase CwlO-like protein
MRAERIFCRWWVKVTIGHKIFSLKGGHPLKKWIAVLIAVALVFGAVGSESWASSQDLKKYQEQLKKLQSDMKRIDEQQRRLTSSQRSVVQKIGSIEDSIRSVESEMDTISDQIVMTEGTLNVTMMELADAESKIVEKKDTLNQRLRVMYKTGHVGYLEVLLGFL